MRKVCHLQRRSSQTGTRFIRRNSLFPLSQVASKRDVFNTISSQECRWKVDNPPRKMKVAAQAYASICLVTGELLSWTTWRFLVMFETFAHLKSVVAAIQCNTTDQSGVSLSLSNQDDVDLKLAGCTSISGGLAIAQNYTGPFVLNNITSISGGITTASSTSTTQKVTGLTSFEVNDLIDMGDLHIWNVPALKSITFRNLQSSSRVGLQLELEGVEISFPALENATEFVLCGHISRSFSRPYLCLNCCWFI